MTDQPFSSVTSKSAAIPGNAAPAAPATVVSESEIALDVPLVEAAPQDPETPVETPDFASFGVSESIATALSEAGIVHPFPIQALTLPIALAGTDVIGQARTGTGKTLASESRILQRVTVARDEAPR